MLDVQAYAAGGVEADKHVKAAIRKALAPAALSGQSSSNPKPLPDFDLFHSTQLAHGGHLPFTNMRSGMWFDGCSFVKAEFPQSFSDRDCDRMMCDRLKMFVEPQMHESADEAALAGEFLSCFINHPHPAQAVQLLSASGLAQ